MATIYDSLHDLIKKTHSLKCQKMRKKNILFDCDSTFLLSKPLEK